MPMRRLTVWRFGAISVTFRGRWAGLTGVFLQETNYGRGSPVIRGMVGNRILPEFHRYPPGTKDRDLHSAGSGSYRSDAFGRVVYIVAKSARDPRMGRELEGRIQVQLVP